MTSKCPKSHAWNQDTRSTDHDDSSLWCKDKVDEDEEADCTWFGTYLSPMDTLGTNRKASYIDWKSQKSFKDRNSRQQAK